MEHDLSTSVFEEGGEWFWFDEHDDRVGPYDDEGSAMAAFISHYDRLAELGGLL